MHSLGTYCVLDTVMICIVSELNPRSAPMASFWKLIIITKQTERSIEALVSQFCPMAGLLCRFLGD